MKKEDDEMEGAFVRLDPDLKIGSLVGTGIKLRATDKRTGKPVTSGFQLDNSRMEIMAVSDIEVEVVGFKDMYEALKEVREYYNLHSSHLPDFWMSMIKALNEIDSKS